MGIVFRSGGRGGGWVGRQNASVWRGWSEIKYTRGENWAAEEKKDIDSVREGKEVGKRVPHARDAESQKNQGERRRIMCFWGSRKMTKVTWGGEGRDFQKNKPNERYSARGKKNGNGVSPRTRQRRGRKG